MAAAGQTPPRKKQSTAAIGAYYKSRSKKYLEAQGYAVASMEDVRMIYRPSFPGGPVELQRAIKVDQFGADLHGIRREPTPESVYVQVKGGKTAKSGVSAARREFRKFPFPDFVRREIHVWLLQARAPEIIDCSAEEYTGCDVGAPSGK